jgi:hypothetical protein
VLVDESPVMGATIRLNAGRHILAISAPRYQFYTDTLEIESGKHLDLAPNLVPLGGPAAVRQQRRQQALAPATTTAPAAPVANCDDPAPGYNRDRGCFDQRPRPVLAPFVLVTPDVIGVPRASVLLVKVSAEGKTLEVRQFNPSNDPAFEQLARRYAETMEWRPATKGGVPVIGWTQMAFRPQWQGGGAAGG